MENANKGLTVLDLAESHDLLRPGADPGTALDYLDVLQSHLAVDLEHCSGGGAKDGVQRLVASVNACLLSSSAGSSGSDLFVGLCTLDLLLDQCQCLGPQQQAIMAQHLPGFLNAILKRQRTLDDQDHAVAAATKACQVLRKVMFFSASAHSDLPELSRHLSANASQVVANLLGYLRAHDRHPHLDTAALECLEAAMTVFPGACGVQAVAAGIEACLLGLLNKVADCDRLAAVFALLPRVGGSGREGQHHREAWTRQHLRLWKTLDDLVENLLGNVAKAQKRSVDDDLQVLPLELPHSSSGDLLSKAFHGANQVEAVCRLIAGGLRGPFPVAKALPLAGSPDEEDPWLKVAGKVFLLKKGSTTASGSAGGHLENLILTAITPKLQVSVLRLLADMVKILGEDLLPASPRLFGLALGALKEASCLSSGGFPEVRVASHQLLTALCDAFKAGSGLEASAGTLLPCLLADVVPPVKSLTLMKQTKNDSGGTGKNRRRHHNHHQMRGADLLRSTTPRRSSPAICSALETIAAVFNASGPFLSPGHHKTVACALLNLGLFLPDRPLPGPWRDQESDEGLKLRLCEALVSLLANPSPMSAAPVGLVSSVFRRISGDNACTKPVKSVCRSGLALCEAILHPRSASLNLDLPLTVDDLEAINKDLMKVHTVVVLRGSEQVLEEPLHSSNSPEGNVESGSDDGGSEAVEERVRVVEAPADAAKSGLDLGEGLQEFREQLAADQKLRHRAMASVGGEDDEDAVLSHEENKRLMDKVYGLNSGGDGKASLSVVIHREEGSRERSGKETSRKRPDWNSKTCGSEASAKKKRSVEEADGEVDLKTMLSTFTPN